MRKGRCYSGFLNAGVGQNIQKLMVLNTQSSWKQFKACHAIVLLGELHLLAFDLCGRAALFSPCHGLLDPRSVILKIRCLFLGLRGISNYCRFWDL